VDISAALDISRSNCYADRIDSPERDRSDEDHLVEHIKTIAGEHPFWGYRRITAWLKHREGHLVNRKRIYALMKRHNLLVKQRPHKAKRTPQRSKPKASRPRQYWGIDMTKFMVPLVGWIYLVIVLDWFTKKIVGYSMGMRCRSPRGNVHGVHREEDIKLISDNGSQPTSTSFMKDMATLGIEQIFTSYDNPKGNADTERVMRTVKEEIIWLNEFKAFFDAREKVSSWIERDYNREYPHSVLDYMSPCEFEAAYWREAEKTALKIACNERSQGSWYEILHQFEHEEILVRT
jgi:transposase InsO family protein